MGPRSVRVLLAAAVAACCLTSDMQPRAATQAYGLTGGVVWHTALPGDTLASVGSRLGADPQTIAAKSSLKPNARLTPGQVVRVDNRHIVPPELAPGVIIVNVPQRMLFFDDGTGVMAFPIAVGKATWRTPLGAFHIVRREENPTWNVPESIQAEARRAGHSLPAAVPPGPDNPLGKYYLALSLGDVGIHGTNAPASIYRVTTHGCIRVHPDDIATLFPRVTLQTTGRVVYEPVLLASIDDRVYVEAHRDVYGRTPDASGDLHRWADAAGVADRIDWGVVAAVLKARDGVARDVTRKNPHDAETLPH